MAITLPFSRPTVARQSDSVGIWNQVGINVPRNAHYLNGILQPPLIEAAATNQLLWSRDLTNGVWSGTAAPVNDLVGLDGTPAPNGGTTITDNSAVSFLNKFQSFAIPNDGNNYVARWWIKKDTDQTRFPLLAVNLSGGAIAQGRRISLNTQTGAFAQVNIVGAGGGSVQDLGNAWLVDVYVTNNNSGNTTMLVTTYPAAKPTLTGVDTASVVGSLGVLNIQADSIPGTVGSSPIFTTNAPVLRAADIDQLLSATSRGYTRVNGNFGVDGFNVGQPLTPIGFSDFRPKNIISVSSKEILTRPPPATVEVVQAGRQLSSVYSYSSIGESLAPDVSPIDLRKDTTSGVLINANDSAQAAAHPNTKAAAVGRGDTTKRKQYVIKNPTEIAGKIVREDLH